MPALFEGQTGLEKIPENLPSNPVDLPNPTSDVTKPEDISKSNLDMTKPEAPAVGPVSSAVPPSADNNPIIGAPTAVNQTPRPELAKEMGAYQIPAMPGPAPSDSAMTVTKASQVPEPPPAFDSAKWSHPDRLQRTRWRESLGETSNGSSLSSN